MDTSWKFPTRIYDLFNLRKGEEGNVVLILLFSFFQFFAVALFFVTANAIFLSDHSIGELPYVFIATGVVLFAFSFINKHVENVFTQKQVILGEAFLLLAIIALLRLVTVYPNPASSIIRVQIAGYGGTSLQVEAYNEMEMRYYTLNAIYNAQENSFDIGLTNINPGYYRLMVTYGTTTTTHRIMKE